MSFFERLQRVKESRKSQQQSPASLPLHSLFCTTLRTQIDVMHHDFLFNSLKFLCVMYGCFDIIDDIFHLWCETYNPFDHNGDPNTSILFMHGIPLFYATNADRRTFDEANAKLYMDLKNLFVRNGKLSAAWRDCLAILTEGGDSKDMHNDAHFISMTAFTITEQFGIEGDLLDQFTSIIFSYCSYTLDRTHPNRMDDEQFVKFLWGLNFEEDVLLRLSCSDGFFDAPAQTLACKEWGWFGLLAAEREKNGSVLDPGGGMTGTFLRRFAIALVEEDAGGFRFLSLGARDDGSDIADVMEATWDSLNVKREVDAYRRRTALLQRGIEEDIRMEDRAIVRKRAGESSENPDDIDLMLTPKAMQMKHEQRLPNDMSDSDAMRRGPQEMTSRHSRSKSNSHINRRAYNFSRRGARTARSRSYSRSRSRSRPRN